MAYNIPGIFKLVQGVPPRSPRYGPVAPRPAAPMGFTDGGEYNIPGYDGREIMKPEDWVGSGSMGGAPGAGDGGGGGDAVTGESIYIRHLADAYGMTVEEAAAQWEDMTPDQKKTVMDSYFGKKDASGDSGLAGTYAQIAENARQFNEQMAFDRARAEQQDKQNRWQAEMTRQQALSDFSSARDAAKVARKSMFNDAATQAIQAHQAGLGQANIPGIENWRMDGGADSAAIIDRAPIVGFNPSLTYGEQLEAPADLYQPNIPGVNF